MPAGPGRGFTPRPPSVLLIVVAFTKLLCGLRLCARALPGAAGHTAVPTVSPGVPLPLGLAPAPAGGSFSGPSAPHTAQNLSLEPRPPGSPHVPVCSAEWPCWRGPWVDRQTGPRQKPLLAKVVPRLATGVLNADLALVGDALPRGLRGQTGLLVSLLTLRRRNGGHQRASSLRGAVLARNASCPRPAPRLGCLDPTLPTCRWARGCPRGAPGAASTAERRREVLIRISGSSVRTAPPCVWPVCDLRAPVPVGPAVSDRRVRALCTGEKPVLRPGHSHPCRSPGSLLVGQPGEGAWREGEKDTHTGCWGSPRCAGPRPASPGGLRPGCPGLLCLLG